MKVVLGEVANGLAVNVGHIILEKRNSILAALLCECQAKGRRSEGIVRRFKNGAAHCGEMSKHTSYQICLGAWFRLRCDFRARFRSSIVCCQGLEELYLHAEPEDRVVRCLRPLGR